MARHLLLLVLSGGATVLTAQALRAHGIQSTLEYLPTFPGAETMEIRSSFSTGVPARDATVRLLPADGGTAIELGHTGEDGRLSFSLPSSARAGWEIQVDAGPGHRDYLGSTDAEIVPSTGTTHALRADPILPPRARIKGYAGALTGLVLVGGLSFVAGLHRRR